MYWDDWLLLCIQGAGLIAIVVYVWKTWQMAAATKRAAEASLAAVQESRDARLEALAPRIVVYFEGSRNFSAQIVIYNAGNGTAGDLRLSFNPRLQNSQNPELLAFFDTPQSIVPPHYRIVQAFDSWPGYFQSNLPSRYRVEARYVGLENGKPYTTTHVLDVEGIRHRLAESDDGEAQNIQKALTELSRDFRKFIQIADHHSQTRVYQNSALFLRSDGARLLMHLWQTARDMRGGAFIRDWPAFLSLIRSIAIATLANRTDDSSTALSKVVTVLHAFGADHIGNAAWHLEADAAFAELARALGLDPERPNASRPAEP